MDEADPDAPERDGDEPDRTDDGEDVFRWGAVDDDDDDDDEYACQDEILGAHDDIRGEPVYVVADVSCDEAWVAVPDETAIDLVDWR